MLRIFFVIADMKSLPWRKKYAWVRGLLSRRSCVTKAGKPKVALSKNAAQDAKASMEKKYAPKKFDTYCCLWCGKWHVGGAA